MRCAYTSGRRLFTSGDYERFFDEGGVRYHHILDPKTGKLSHEVRSVTIIASNATRTDGLTKTVFILGPKGGPGFISARTDADAIVITTDSRSVTSKVCSLPTGRTQGRPAPARSSEARAGSLRGYCRSGASAHRTWRWPRQG